MMIAGGRLWLAVHGRYRRHACVRRSGLSRHELDSERTEQAAVERDHRSR